MQNLSREYSYCKSHKGRGTVKHIFLILGSANILISIFLYVWIKLFTKNPHNHFVFLSSVPSLMNVHFVQFKVQ